MLALFLSLTIPAIIFLRARHHRGFGGTLGARFSDGLAAHVRRRTRARMFFAWVVAIVSGAFIPVATTIVALNLGLLDYFAVGG